MQTKMEKLKKEEGEMRANMALSYSMNPSQFEESLWIKRRSWNIWKVQCPCNPNWQARGKVMENCTCTDYELFIILFYLGNDPLSQSKKKIRLRRILCFPCRRKQGYPIYCQVVRWLCLLEASCEVRKLWSWDCNAMMIVNIHKLWSFWILITWLEGHCNGHK